MRDERVYSLEGPSETFWKQEVVILGRETAGAFSAKGAELTIGMVSALP